MKKLNLNQAIGVFAGLALLAYLLFSGPIMNLFNPTMADTNNQDSLESSATELTVQEVTVGTGEVAEAGDTITVHYIGALTDGKVFESSRDSNTPYTFTLGAGTVIRGWDEGLVGMRVGGKRILVLPPAYAYGDQAAGAIAPNSTLIFEVELLDVEKPSSR